MLISRTDYAGALGVIKLIEHIDGFLDQKVLLLSSLILKHVKPQWVVHVRWREVDDILGALFGDHGEQFFGGVTMGINKRKAAALEHILERQIFHQHTFAGPGLADNIDVTMAILFR